MDTVKKMMMITSLVFIILCLAASLYFTVALPAGDPNFMTFVLFVVVFAAAAVWMGLNVYNLFK